MKYKWEIILIFALIAVLFLLGGCQNYPLTGDVAGDEKIDLSTLKQVEEVKTFIKDTNWAFYKNKDGEILKKEITNTEYSSLSVKTPTNMEVKDYEFVSAIGGSPVYATSAPILKDGEYFLVTGNVASGTEVIKVKLPGEAEKIITHADVKVSTLPWFLKAFSKEADAAIIYDNADHWNNADTAGTSFTNAFTSTTTDNRVMFVGLRSFGGSIVTSVTYAGTPLATSCSAIENTTGHYVYAFTMVAPATGANNVVVKLSASNYLYEGVSTFANAAQTSQPNGNSCTDQTNAATTLMSVTMTVDNSWLTAYSFNGVDVFSAGTSTLIKDNYGGNAIFISDTTRTPVTVQSLTASHGSSGYHAWSIVAFSPYAEAPPAGGTPPTQYQPIIIFE